MIFEMLDHAIADELGVRVGVYVKYIEKMNIDSANKIINLVLNGEDGELEEAKEIWLSELSKLD